MAKRLQRMPQSAHKYRHGFRPTFHPDEIRKFRDRSAGWRKPKRVFVGSMGDIMDPGFDDEQIREVIRVAVAFPRHTFMFLSKRPDRYRCFSWPENAWLGASATDQKMADYAGRAFIGMTDNIVFLSCEPLLGEIALHWLPEWVIIGSMTGPGAKPPRREWVADLTEWARIARVACFHKDNLKPHFGDAFTRREFPDDQRQHALPFP